VFNNVLQKSKSDGGRWVFGEIVNNDPLFGGSGLNNALVFVVANDR
jgi:hypothetical protein